MKKDNQTIKEFIKQNTENHSSDITILLAKNFGFSRQTAHKYISREIMEGKIIKIGVGAGTRYFLAGGKHINFSINIKSGQTEEDRVFTKYIKPMLIDFPDNVYRIINYTFTEILNNVIDHSGGHSAYIDFRIEDNNINIEVIDNGIGIFQKLQNALNLESKREAILHLSKGKFTTDPENHTGEGIFFSSRMLDKFSIFSSDLFYTFTGNDWFLSSEKPEAFGGGTYIKMILSKNSKTEPKEIFNKYTDNDINFNKTIVAVSLSTDPDDPHVSRSQAKRLLLGLDKFRSVVLDFKGVGFVGQAFADEIFRVFTNEHPDIKIQYLNANEEIVKMILRASEKKQ